MSVLVIAIVGAVLVAALALGICAAAGRADQLAEIAHERDAARLTGSETNGKG